MDALRIPQRFTLLQMLVAVGVFGILLALAVPWIHAARENQQVVQCRDNLRQLALGVQNHHDQRGDCPPLAMFDHGISWAALLQPYCEKRRNFPVLSPDQRYDAASNGQAIGLKGDLALGDYLFCPAKRGAPQRIDGYPAGDYAAPSVGRVSSNDPALDDTWMQAHQFAQNTGPLLVLYRVQPQSWIDRPGTRSRGEARNYRSLTSFASWGNGTMKQAVFGEKALLRRRDGRLERGGDFTVTAWLENDMRASGCARNGGERLQRSVDELAELAWSRFGSWHPGVTLFAFGDAHVDAVQNYVSSSVIYDTCDRHDFVCHYRG
jgi:type II secretory pathway pseudopilin PulG